MGGAAEGFDQFGLEIAAVGLGGPGVHGGADQEVDALAELRGEAHAAAEPVHEGLAVDGWVEAGAGEQEVQAGQVVAGLGDAAALEHGVVERVGTGQVAVGAAVGQLGVEGEGDDHLVGPDLVEQVGRGLVGFEAFEEGGIVERDQFAQDFTLGFDSAGGLAGALGGGLVERGDGEAVVA